MKHDFLKEKGREQALTERFQGDLARAGHTNASIAFADCEGYVVATVSGLELEPEQVPTLARALRLINNNNKKAFAVLGAMLALLEE